LPVEADESRGRGWSGNAEPEYDFSMPTEDPPQLGIGIAERCPPKDESPWRVLLPRLGAAVAPLAVLGSESAQKAWIGGIGLPAARLAVAGTSRSPDEADNSRDRGWSGNAEPEYDFSMALEDQQDRLANFLAALEREHGPIDPHILDEVRREWPAPVDIPAPPSEKSASLTPIVRSLLGILRGSGLDELAYRRHLEDKYLGRTS
jgi:hypothetical protein